MSDTQETGAERTNCESLYSCKAIGDEIKDENIKK